MTQRYLKIQNLPTYQNYRIESLGAKAKNYDKKPTFNLRGMKDHQLYRRVYSTRNLSAIYDIYGEGSIIEILDKTLIGDFEIVNIKFIRADKAEKQLDLFD